jgi:hypothetical protein
MSIKKNQKKLNFHTSAKKRVTNWRESTKKQPHWWFQTHQKSSDQGFGEDPWI